MLPRDEASQRHRQVRWRGCQVNESQPKQGEAAVQFVVEHRFQVELRVGGAGEADVVAQNAEAQPIADKGP